MSSGRRSTGSSPAGPRPPSARRPQRAEPPRGAARRRGEDADEPTPAPARHVDRGAEEDRRRCGGRLRRAGLPRDRDQGDRAARRGRRGDDLQVLPEQAGPPPGRHRSRRRTARRARAGALHGPALRGDLPDLRGVLAGAPRRAHRLRARAPAAGAHPRAGAAVRRRAAARHRRQGLRAAPREGITLIEHFQREGQIVEVAAAPRHPLRRLDVRGVHRPPRVHRPRCGVGRRGGDRAGHRLRDPRPLASRARVTPRVGVRPPAARRRAAAQLVVSSERSCDGDTW